MSEIKGQILGVILVLAVFGVVGTTLYTAFKTASSPSTSDSIRWIMASIPFSMFIWHTRTQNDRTRRMEMRKARIAYISTSAAEIIAFPTASGRLASTETPAVATRACLMADTQPPSAIGRAAQNRYMP